MMETTLGATFLIVFRETLEAGIIVGIIFTILNRLSAQRYYKHVVISVLLAVAASFGAAVALSAATESVQGDYEKIIEGVISLIACGVLTYMVIWMKQQARKMKSDIETKLTSAVSGNDLAVMIALPFVSVFREGAETVLFLKAVSMQAGEAVSWIGGITGMGLAAILTGMIFISGKKISLKPFFAGTGILLVFVAAGLLAYGIHELEEVGWINGIIYPIWNINHILNEKEGVGSFLKALFGYNGNPSLLEFTLYVVYLTGALFYTLKNPGQTESTASNAINKPKT
jgi:high-affinity iron transporter